MWVWRERIGKKTSPSEPNPTCSLVWGATQCPFTNQATGGRCGIVQLGRSRAGWRWAQDGTWPPRVSKRENLEEFSGINPDKACPAARLGQQAKGVQPSGYKILPWAVPTPFPLLLKAKWGKCSFAALMHSRWMDGEEEREKKNKKCLWP